MIFVLGNSCMIIKSKYKEKVLQLRHVRDAVSYLHIDPAESKMDLLVVSDEIFVRPDSKKLVMALMDKHPAVNVLCLCLKSMVEVEGMKSAKIKDMKAPLVITEVEKHLKVIMNESSPQLTPFSDEVVESSSEDEEIEEEDIDWETPEENNAKNMPNSSKTMDAEKLKQRAQGVSSQALKELGKVTKRVKEVASGVQIVVEINDGLQTDTDSDSTPLDKSQFSDFKMEQEPEAKRVKTDVSLDNHIFGVGEFRPISEELVVEEANLMEAVKESLHFLDSTLQDTPTNMSDVEKYAAITLAVNTSMKQQGIPLDFSLMSQEDLDVLPESVLPVGKEYLKLVLPELKKMTKSNQINFDAVNKEIMNSMNISVDKSFEKFELALHTTRPSGTGLNFEAVSHEVAQMATVPREYSALILPELRTREIFASATKFMEVDEKVILPQININNARKYEELSLHFTNELKSAGININFEELRAEQIAQLPDTVNINKEYAKLILPQMQLNKVNESAVGYLRQLNLPESEDLYDNVTAVMNYVLTSYNVSFEELTEAQLRGLQQIPFDVDFLVGILPQIRLRTAQRQALGFVNLDKVLNVSSAVQATQYSELALTINNSLRGKVSINFEEMTKEQLESLPEEILPYNKEYLLMVLPSVKQAVSQAIALQSISKGTQYEEIVLKVNTQLSNSNIVLTLEEMTEEQLRALSQEVLAYDKEYLLKLLPEIRKQRQYATISNPNVKPVSYDTLVLNVNTALSRAGYNIAFEAMTSEQVSSIPEEVLPYNKEYLQFVLPQLQWKDYGNSLDFQTTQKPVQDVELVATTEQERNMYQSMNLSFTDKVVVKTYFISPKDSADVLLRRSSHIFKDALLKVFSNIDGSILDLLVYAGINQTLTLSDLPEQEFWNSLPVLAGFNDEQKYYMLMLTSPSSRYEVIYYNYYMQGIELTTEQLQEMAKFCNSLPVYQQSLTEEQASVVNYYVTQHSNTLKKVDEEILKLLTMHKINPEILTYWGISDKLAILYAILVPEDRILLMSIDIPEQVLFNTSLSSLSEDVLQLIWQSTVLQTKCLFTLTEEWLNIMGVDYTTAYNFMASLPEQITKRYDLYRLDEARLQILQDRLNI